MKGQGPEGWNGKLAAIALKEFDDRTGEKFPHLRRGKKHQKKIDRAAARARASLAREAERDAKR